MHFHVEAPALAGLDAVSAILCAACLVPVRSNCSWCRFLLLVWFGLVEHEQHLLFRLAAVSAAVSVEGLLMQFHVEVLALPFVDAVSANLCAAMCLFLCVQIAVGAGSCFWFAFGLWSMSSICCSVCCCFCCCFC